MTLNLHPDILEAIQRALAEDIGHGDVTTDSIVPVEAAMRLVLTGGISGAAA